MFVGKVLPHLSQPFVAQPAHDRRAASHGRRPSDLLADLPPRTDTYSEQSTEK